MFCPGCATESADGAKFCKSCGMNLTVITQALSGGVSVSDPIRDREYKRARKQISDGIQGAAAGAALVVAAVLAYLLIHNYALVYAGSLVLALGGTVKLFRSVGRVVDAKVGPRLIDPSLQTRSTSGLSSAQVLPSGPTVSAPSRRLPGESGRLASPRVPGTRPVVPSGGAGEPGASRRLSDAGLPPASLPRVNREHSSPLSKLDPEDDLMSKLRN